MDYGLGTSHESERRTCTLLPARPPSKLNLALVFQCLFVTERQYEEPPEEGACKKFPGDGTAPGGRIWTTRQVRRWKTRVLVP